MFGKQNDSLFEASQQTNKLKIKHVKFSNLFLLIRLAHSLRDKHAIKLLSNLRHSNTYSFEWDEDRKRIPIILDKYSQKYSFVLSIYLKSTFNSIEMCFVDLLLNNFNNWYKKYYISYRFVLNFSQGLHKPNLTSSLGSDTLYWNPVLWKTFFTIRKRDHLFDCFVCWYLWPVLQWQGSSTVEAQPRSSYFTLHLHSIFKQNWDCISAVCFNHDLQCLTLTLMLMSISAGHLMKTSVTYR